jgi:hypothetical protein
MNTRMDDIARQHISDLRHQAASHRSAAGSGETGPGHDAVRTPRLRRHVGFALVEAGFYLLGTDRLTVPR